VTGADAEHEAVAERVGETPAGRGDLRRVLGPDVQDRGADQQPVAAGQQVFGNGQIGGGGATDPQGGHADVVQFGPDLPEPALVGRQSFAADPEAK
jgi:hypothetical protein